MTESQNTVTISVQEYEGLKAARRRDAEVFYILSKRGYSEQMETPQSLAELIRQHEAERLNRLLLCSQCGRALVYKRREDGNITVFNECCKSLRQRE